ncbi:MAG: cysteine--tRNA ligase [Nanoarchaeota archaeon]
MIIKDEIYFYNSLSRKKELFEPKDEIVKMYSCGPTVYSRQHIGNMRAAVFVDVLKRVLKYFKYKVEDVTNITDVGHLVSDESEGEDKMLKASKTENKNPYEIAEKYTNLYIEDLKKLNIILPKYMPRATKHIDKQLEIIEELDKRGYTYKTSDGIYFDTSKFKEYGMLSKQSLKEKKAGARINNSIEKKNPQDFALWKFLIGENKNHIMKWNSKYGVGFPGWHIECSAMASEYLGDNIDIHTGGIEHIGVHHENEIAQNVCSGAIKNVSFWIHNAHLKVDNEKMSKSLGNVYNIDSLVEKGFHPLAFRELCLRTHYRKELNFTIDSLKAGEANIKKINEFYEYIKNLTPKSKEDSLKKIIDLHLDKFEDAIKDDLNTPKALAAIYELINEIYRKKYLSKEDINLTIEFMERTNKILALIEKKEDIPQDIITLAKDRQKARKNKNFELADKLRTDIESLGYEIKDSKESKEGFIISKK